MRKYRNLSHLFLLISACLSVNALAQEAVNSGMWSDASTWSGGELPQAGGSVTIGHDVAVVLDTSTPELGGITINGKLSFSDSADLELSTEWIMVHGELEIGTEAKPHTRNATITLTDNVKNEQLMGMGDRGIMVSGGTLNLHGNRSNAWTRLNATAEAGSSNIEVLNAEQWQVGDEIVLASTDYDPRQAEARRITAISGNRITLDAPLQYMHYGEVTYGVDQRGEVGLLTRNIKVRASDDAEASFFGGHIMAMVTSKMYVEGVELHRMGQNLELARYPIHWHLVGDGGEGQYIRNAAIHDTFNRCVTVHGTNYLQIENNVTYNNVGHCFFMEDGIEHSNRFISNLAIQSKCHTSKPCNPTDLAPFGSTDDGLNFKTEGQNSPDVLIPSDNTVSSYWITNPDNTYIGNVAAGSDATGFWLAFPDHPTGAFEGSEDSQNTWPAGTKFREFRGNVSHSNVDGLMQDRGPLPDGRTRAWGYIAFADPANRTGPLVDTIEDFTAYKNRNSGIWGRGELHVYRGLKFADNGIGFTHAGGNFDGSYYEFTSRVIDSLFVGESDNIGNPRAPSEIAYGRSLPQPKVPDFPIRAYEFYDQFHELEDITFINYADNDTRKTGAISHLLFTSFGMSTYNTAKGMEFVNAKPVYHPPLEPAEINNRWSNDDWGNVSYQNAVFNDADGSITGIPDSYIIITGGIDGMDDCEARPSWNAVVCTGDIGRMNLGGGGITGLGGGPGSGGIAPGGGRIRGVIQPSGVMLSRNGHAFPANGATNVRAGSEYTVTSQNDSVNLRVMELDPGSWVMFRLPGFTTAEAGTEQNSMAALRDATETSWFKDDDAVWVKLVSTANMATRTSRDADSLVVSR